MKRDMKRLITLLAALTLTVAAFAQRSLLQPRLEIVEIEADADNAAPFQVFWMEDEGVNHYYLSVGNLGVGNNFIQFHVDPLYELFIPLGASIEEAIETLEMLKEFYKRFEPVVDKTMKARSEHKAGERILGNDPESGKPVSVKIGRYGPLVQIGSADDKEKPRFAQMPKELSLETITLEEALELFRLPRDLGKFEGKEVTIGTGRYGAYILHNRKYVTLPKNTDPLTVTLEEAIALIEDSRNAEKQRHLKSFEEDVKLEVMNGRYGPYLAYDGKNYRLPKNLHEKAAELSYDECMAIINKEQQRG